MRWAISLWACQTDPWRGMSLQSRGGLWLPLTKPPLEKQIYPTTQATSLSESHAYPWKNNTLLLRWAPRRMSDVLATAELAFSHSRQHLGLVFTRLTSIWRHWWKWSSHSQQALLSILHIETLTLTENCCLLLRRVYPLDLHLQLISAFCLHVLLSTLACNKVLLSFMSVTQCDCPLPSDLDKNQIQQ